MDEYQSGPDVSAHFPLVKDAEVPLPLDFDTTCKCGKELERVSMIYLSRRRPFAAFTCKECPNRLYLYEAPRIPFIMTQDDFPSSLIESSRFSEYVDFLIGEREKKYLRNKHRAETASR